jgi:hypothetical protein
MRIYETTTRAIIEEMERGAVHRESSIMQRNQAKATSSTGC